MEKSTFQVSVKFRYVSRFAAALMAGTFLSVSVAQAGHAVIKRDTYGIPHIYADDTRSLFYGYGYAVAEDRLYQMEIVKRSAEGTVSEVLGRKYLEVDKATRSNLDPISLRAQLETMSSNDRAMFEGYAAGFNARIREVMAHQDTLLPKAFLDNKFEPSLWKPYDVAAVWVGLILNRFFSGNMELANLHLLEALKTSKGSLEGERIYRQLRPLDDPTAPTIEATASSKRATGTDAHLPRLASRLSPLSSETVDFYQSRQIALIGASAASGMPTASNAWVIAPSRSTAGHTVLQNGPQQGWFSPSILYSVGLHGAGFDITGSTPVALPAIFFGTNGRIAWGSTVGALDTNDLYQEHLDPSDTHRFLYKGRSWPMKVRQEVLKVRGEADVLMSIYSTAHGVVDAWDRSNGTAYALKRSWTGHEVETLLGWAHVGQARNWAGFLGQAKRVAASITWFYADTSGHIGYAGLGLLPRRPSNQQIQFPANGDGSMEWQGTLPFTTNPRQLDPAQGYLVSWNNKTNPGLAADGADYSHVDRVNELSSQILLRPKLSDNEIWAIDQYGARADLNHRYLSPLIAQAIASLSQNDPVRLAGESIVAWDGQLIDAGNSPFYVGAGTAIFRTWLPIMLHDLFAADLPADVFSRFAGTGYLPAFSPMSAKPGSGTKLLWNAFQKGKNGNPFAYDFFHGRDPNEMIRKALAAAVLQMTAAQGKTMANWRTPAIPMRFAVDTPLGVPWAAADAAHDVASYRNRGSISLQVILDRKGTKMCSAAAPGESGFVSPAGKSDPHVADQMPLFETYACKPDRTTRADLDANTERTKTLDF
jgi:penicillin amidase